jgi:hypothetical protein
MAAHHRRTSLSGLDSGPHSFLGRCHSASPDASSTALRSLLLTSASTPRFFSATRQFDHLEADLDAVGRERRWCRR